MTVHNMALALIVLMFATFIGSLFAVQIYTLTGRPAKRTVAVRWAVDQARQAGVARGARI
jgi:hypothetical protein